MSISDIEQELQGIYGYRLSTFTISIITDKINQHVQDWQNRPLEAVYCIVWMDGIVFKVRQGGKVVNKIIYLAVGVNREGYKEIMGMWLEQNESAAFWRGVMTDLIENLNGKIRKYTKNKIIFPTDESLKKSVFLSLMQISKKWTQPIQNRGLIFNQFLAIFENRGQL